MAVNLFNVLDSEFSDDVVAKIGSYLNEQPAKAKVGLANAVPAILCALHQKTATTAGQNDLFGMLQRGGFDGRSHDNLGRIAASAGGLADLAKVGAPLLATLFGARQNPLIDWLASAAGIGKSASSSLLGLAVPLVLNVLGRQTASAGGFDVGTLTRLIKDQGVTLGSASPAGLAQALGVSHCGEAPARVQPAAAPARPVPAPVREPESGGPWRWLIPLLLLPLLFLGWRSCQREPAREAVAPTTTLAPRPAPTTTLAPAATAAVGLIKRNLSCGQELEFAPNGIEAGLIGFIDDKTTVVDGKKWFSFDRLEFETDSATLKPSSRAQLRNIADILKCYSNVDLKIGGYTDNTGDKAYNLKLSQERARNTMNELVAGGVAASRLSAEGYGEQFPVASNDTDEGRQRNRRIDVNVTKK
jgi:outer membrane protein OmpA-like peptidoglycan-associated protein